MQWMACSNILEIAPDLLVRQSCIVCNFWSSNFRNKVSIFQEYSKNTQIQVNSLPFSQILTNYHYQNNSIYVKINCLELLEGRT